MSENNSDIDLQIYAKNRYLHLAQASLRPYSSKIAFCSLFISLITCRKIFTFSFDGKSKKILLLS